MKNFSLVCPQKRLEDLASDGAVIDQSSDRIIGSRLIESEIRNGVFTIGVVEIAAFFLRLTAK